MRKGFFSILTICVIILFSGCHSETENEVSPPFFKAFDEQTGGTVYMLGTIHVGAPNTVYPDAVYAALDECGTLAVEVDLQELDRDRAQLDSAMKLLECPDGTAADLLGGDYAEIRRFFRSKKIYSANLERYIPAMWSAVLSSKIAADCGYSAEFGTDRAMLSYAKKHNKQIFELETAAEQYQINADESPALRTYTLKMSVQTDYELQKEEMRELYRAWSESDFDALEQMIAEDEVPAELLSDYGDYYAEMYENRQKKMADYMISCLKSGEKVFAAVGAMHYFASPDIIDFLEDAGYKVTRVY